MQTRSLFVLSGLVLLSVGGMRAGNVAVSATPDPQAGIAAAARPLDCEHGPCDSVALGMHAFFDRQLHGLDGNGRSCADCHMPTDHFQLSPANAEARFQMLQRRRQSNPNADDPLFRAIDADDFPTNGDSAGDFSNLRENGLVRIVFALPPTMRLIDPATGAPSDEVSVAVWRMVPSVENVALTGPDGQNPWARGPNAFGGYQLDARVATLQEQALGALTNHARIQHAPPQRLLDDLSSFQRTLFTSLSVRALSEAIDGDASPLPVVDRYIEFFKRVQANTAPGAPPPPVATTDGVHFDRRPLPEERAALLAYLRKL